MYVNIKMMKCIGIVTLFSMHCALASINFGSKESSVVVNQGSTLYIQTHLDINGGNLVSQSDDGDHIGHILGPNIQFTKGRFTFFNSVSDLTGIVAPDNTEQFAGTIKLGQTSDVNGSTMITNPGGMKGAHIEVYAGTNYLRGQAVFNIDNAANSNDIIFKDKGLTAVLAVALQNTLKTNITLNTGVLFLQDDLRLGGNSHILDSGWVYFNGRRLSLGGLASTWNGNVVWVDPDLQLNGDVTLNGIWYLLNSGTLNGNGTVIDISNGGTLYVYPGADIAFSSVHIKGLGSGTIRIASDATLHFSDVTIEMDDDFNFNSGTVIIEGNSTVITKQHTMSFIDNPDDATINGKLIVDRATFYYDTASEIDHGTSIVPLLINDPARRYVDILGGGQIVSIPTNPVSFNTYKSESTMRRYTIVAPYRQWVVNPEPDISLPGGLNYDVIIDGNTNFMGFTRTDEKVFIVSTGVHATTQNINMRDLSPRHIDLSRAGSSLTFGDKTMVVISRNDVLDYPWVFEGDTVLKGGGSILELGENGAIVLKGSTSTLLLDGITLKGIKNNKIRCLDDGGKITLKDIKWIQSDDATYDKGSLEILNDVAMVGPYNLTYNSRMPLSILGNSTLSWIRNMQFTYAPVTGDSTLLRFVDATSTLMMDEATLASTAESLTLSTGLLMIRDRNFRQGTIIFASSLTLDQPTGATLESIG